MFVKQEHIPKIILTALSDDTIKGLHVRTNSFKEFEFHGHDYFEFEYILKGEGYTVINDDKHSFKEGDVVFINPMDLHNLKSDEELMTVTVHFNISNVDPNLVDIVNANSCVMKATDKMKECFLNLVDEKNKKGELRYLAYRNLIERIVLLFIRERSVNINNDLPKEIVYSIGYIKQNFRKELSLKKISAEFGYSEEHFCRLFKKITGKTFTEYLTDVRIMYAKNLALNKNYSVTQICFESGFGSVRSLTRVFRDRCGCSLTEYRNKILLSENKL